MITGIRSPVPATPPVTPPVTPPATPPVTPPAIILSPNPLDETQDFSSFFNSPKASPSAQAQVLENLDINGDRVGTSGSCSSNDGPSSSSSIPRPVEMVRSVSDRRDNRPQRHNGWHPRGFRGDNVGMVNYGSKHYDYRDRNDWCYYSPTGFRDPQLQLGYPRPPYVPTNMPPAPPLHCVYGATQNPGYLPQMYIVPTNRGHPFVYSPAAPFPAPTPMPSTLDDHKRVSIMKQIEYYFSSENLRTDFYLKLHMDSFGWVSIHLIAGFRRIKLLTDSIPLILESLIPSAIVEVENNRVRRRFGWKEWVRKPLRTQTNTDTEKKF